LATTVIVKMGKLKHAWTTLVPLSWLAAPRRDGRVPEGLLAADPRLDSWRMRDPLANSTAPTCDRG
jgi:hypothetical protein